MEQGHLLIRGGRVVDPGGGLDAIRDVACRDGRVTAVGVGLEAPAGARLIDARDLVVCPGFIDAHCHLREPGREDEETIESGAHAAVASGFTTLLAMPNTEPCLDSGPLVSFVAGRGRRTPARVLPIAAITVGRRGEALTEMVELAACGAVAFSDDGNCLADSRLMRRALEYAALTGCPVIDHPEDPSLAAGGVMNEGRLATLMGLPGAPTAAEDVAVYRGIALAALTGGRLHLAHLTSAGAIALLRQARRRGLPVSGEATPHHLTLTEAAVRGYDTRAKVSPPLRTARDRAALRRAVADGTVEVIATDHAPHSVEEKETDFESAAPGMIGLETALPLLLRLSGSVPLSRLLAGLTAHPARLFRLKGRGSLAPGSRADITIFDPAAGWTLTPETILSRSRNTPFLGQELTGRVVSTIRDGVVVFERS